MEKAEKIKMFKNTLSAIELFLQLTEEDVKYIVQYSHNKEDLSYKIKQIASGYRKIGYHVEYLKDFDVIRVDIECSNDTGKMIKGDIYSILKPSSNINIEKFKHNVVFNSYFKFDDIHQINSIAELMIKVK